MSRRDGLGLAGTVTNKRANPGEDSKYYIQVSQTELQVSIRLYESVSEGDEVIVTLRRAG